VKEETHKPRGFCMQTAPFSPSTLAAAPLRKMQ